MQLDGFIRDLALSNLAIDDYLKTNHKQFGAFMSRESRSPGTILVYVGLELVGDGLIKLPFVRALRSAYPQARITWLAGEGRSVYADVLRPLIDGLIDEVVDDAGIGIDTRDLFGVPLEGTPLAGRCYDLLLDTQTRVKTSLIIRRIPHRVVVSGALGFLLSDRRPGIGYRRPQALVRRLLDLVELASGRPPDTSAKLMLDPIYRETAETLLPPGPTYIGVSPGASVAHKCWPLQRFAALARLQAERGRIPVLLLGPKEEGWAEQLAVEVPDAILPLQCAPARDLKSSPLFTIALGARLTAAVANDSGTSHMLAAADVPLLSLFGPTSPEKFAPYTSRGAVVTARQFGSSDAMAEIPLQAVDASLERFLADLSGSSA